MRREEEKRQVEPMSFEEAVARAFGYGALAGESDFEGFIAAMERDDARLNFELEDTSFAGAVSFGPKNGAQFIERLREGFRP